VKRRLPLFVCFISLACTEKNPEPLPNADPPDSGAPVGEADAMIPAGDDAGEPIVTHPDAEVTEPDSGEVPQYT
jgi:hypothetical protein